MASKVEVFLRSIRELPIKTYQCKGMVHASGEVDYADDGDAENTNEVLIDKVKLKASWVKANAIIEVEFKDSLIKGTK